MSFRCVIFAAVSTKPQAGEEKDSIPTQIARARALIERREWQEVHDPLIAPGHTRSISWLHEARDEVPAIADLIELAHSGQIDLVICRDYDRLARKRALLAQISEFLRQRRVQIYALDKPVEPATSFSNYRDDGYNTAALIEAMSGVASEEEVSRIVRRRKFGMNAVMRRGKWKVSERVTPFGYTRLVANDQGETVRLDVPVPVDEEVSLIKRVEGLYLDGYSYGRIADLLNSEGIPSPRGSVWQRQVIKGLLRNEFYCGLILWGYTRGDKVFDPDKGSFVGRDVRAPLVANLLDRTGYLPNVFDLMEYPEECERDQIVIAEGKHEPIRTQRRQKELYAEMAKRRRMGGRAASTTGFCYLFTGLLKCADCGFAFCGRHQEYKGNTSVYYYCSGARYGVPCDNCLYIREDRLYEAVMGVLLDILKKPEVADAYLSQKNAVDHDVLRTERDRLKGALSGLDHKRKRWDDAYETAVIDLATYQKRIAGLVDQREDIAYELGRVERQLAKSVEGHRRREEILALLDDVPPMNDRMATKVYLRNVIEQITILDGEVKVLRMLM